MGRSTFEMTTEDIAGLLPLVDYSEALTIVATEDEVRAACRQGREYGFRAVFSFPHYLPVIVEELKGSDVLAPIAVGFPCGASSTRIKCLEAEEALKAGDLDMVMNIGAFKSKNYKKALSDIEEVVKTAAPFKVPFKVIIETGVLSEEEIVAAAKLVADSGATFIKTCTGFGGGRATTHDVLLIRRTVGDRLKIKASGGVASIEDGLDLLRAGADVLAFRGQLVKQLETLGWPKKS